MIAAADRAPLSATRSRRSANCTKGALLAPNFFKLYTRIKPNFCAWHRCPTACGASRGTRDCGASLQTGDCGASRGTTNRPVPHRLRSVPRDEGLRWVPGSEALRWESHIVAAGLDPARHCNRLRVDIDPCGIVTCRFASRSPILQPNSPSRLRTNDVFLPSPPGRGVGGEGFSLRLIHYTRQPGFTLAKGARGCIRLHPHPQKLLSRRNCHCEERLRRYHLLHPLPRPSNLFPTTARPAPFPSREAIIYLRNALL